MTQNLALLSVAIMDVLLSLDGLPGVCLHSSAREQFVCVCVCVVRRVRMQVSGEAIKCY